MNCAEEKKKYQAELAEVQKRLNVLDDERASLTRVGIRIEGVLAFIASKEREEAEAKAAAAKAAAEKDKPAESAAPAPAAA